MYDPGQKQKEKRQEEKISLCRHTCIEKGAAQSKTALSPKTQRPLVAFNYHIVSFRNWTLLGQGIFSRYYNARAHVCIGGAVGSSLCIAHTPSSVPYAVGGTHGEREREVEGCGSVESLRSTTLTA